MLSPMPSPMLLAIWFQIPADRPNWNMAYSLVIAGLGFVFTVLIGVPIIRVLRAKKIGKQVRPDGPQHHLIKTGTPTMGGIMITLSAFILTFAFNLYGRLSMLLPLGVLLCCGILGAIDDRLSLVGGKRTEGLAARFKLAWLTLFAIVAALILYGPLDLHRLIVPGVGSFDIGLAAIPIAIIGIAGMANAVNLADGLDSLAGGPRRSPSSPTASSPTSRGRSASSPSASRWSGPCWASSGTTPTRRTSSWATPGRWRSARRWRRPAS